MCEWAVRVAVRQSKDLIKQEAGKWICPEYLTPTPDYLHNCQRGLGLPTCVRTSLRPHASSSDLKAKTDITPGEQVTGDQVEQTLGGHSASDVRAIKGSGE